MTLHAMEKRIALNKEGQDTICRAFDVTDRMVRKALAYEKDTDLARRIRKFALQKGGQVMYTLSEMETMHDAYGMIRQYLPGGVIIELGKTDGSGRIVRQGKTLWEGKNVKVEDIEKIQQMAARLAEEAALQE